MKQDSFFHPLKLILGFLLVVLIAALLTGCGSAEDGNLEFGSTAVQFRLPEKGGLSK